MNTQDEPDEITVEVRLSDGAEARRIYEWLQNSPGFVAGAAQRSRSVTIADHIPDDAEGPIVLLASGAGLSAWPADPRVAATLEPGAGLQKLRIAVEAAAHGLSLKESPNRNAGGVQTLTSRELEVLRYIVEGASNKAIARALGISSHTVKFHTAAILEKLGASTRTEAAMQAIRFGLVML